MLMGDFNFVPHELPVMQWLLNQGFQSTAMLHMSKYGTDMPAICRNVTCNDQILLHPRLIACLDSIQVDKTKMFHDHDPVLICSDQIALARRAIQCSQNTLASYLESSTT